MSGFTDLFSSLKRSRSKRKKKKSENYKIERGPSEEADFCFFELGSCTSDSSSCGSTERRARHLFFDSESALVSELIRS
jgi:hypothetical protein